MRGKEEEKKGERGEERKEDQRRDFFGWRD